MLEEIKKLKLNGLTKEQTETFLSDLLKKDDSEIKTIIVEVIDHVDLSECSKDDNDEDLPENVKLIFLNEKISKLMEELREETIK